MFNLLSSSTEWYIDATFRICPPGFYQMLNIIVYNETTQMYCPALYVLMTGKKEFLYDILFNYLRIYADSKKAILHPKYITADFEVALRNSLKRAFCLSKIFGCFFHYSQAIWRRAGRLGLKKKNSIKNNSQLLIGFLQLFDYIPKVKKVQIYSELRKIFEPQHPQFIHLLDYYQKNWYGLNFVNFSELDKETLVRRTNNACEGYHSRLSRLFNKKKERLSIMVSHLLLEELHYRDESIKSLSQSKSKNNILIGLKGINLDKILAFNKLNNLLRGLDLTPQYSIRSLIQNKSFIEDLLILIDECEKEFFITYYAEEQCNQSEIEKIEEIVLMMTMIMMIQKGVS